MVKSANFLLIIIFLLQSFIGLIFNSGNFSYLFNIIVSQIFAILIPLILFIHFNNKKINIKIGEFKTQHTLIAILCTLSINVISQYINIPVLSFMTEQQLNTPIEFTPNGAFEFVTYFLLIAIVPPIIEEYLFRNVVLNEYRGVYGTQKAIILCGLSFSLLHTNPASFIPQFIMGTYLAYLAVKTNGILLPIICHFVHNASLVIIQKLFYSETINLLENNIIVNLFISSLILIFGIYIIGKSINTPIKHFKFHFDKKLTTALYIIFVSIVIGFNIILN